MLLKYNAIVLGSPLDGRVDGFAWATLTFVVWLWTLAFFTKFSLLSVIVVLLDAALPFITLNDLRILPPALVPVPAWLLLGAAAVAVYLSSAVIVNGAFKKTIYPLPK
jgi:succinate-acetate transporter protein